MRHASSKLFGVIRNAQKLRHIGTATSCLKEPTYDAPGKTTVTVMNLMNTGTILINECDERGFTLNNDSVVIGPIAAFPRTILNWNVQSAKDIDEESLSLFLVLEPKVELMVIGLEKSYDFQEVSRIKDILRKAKIPSEVLPVQHAIGIFNFASCEGRYVVGALIPPVEEESKMLVNGKT